MLLNIVIYNIKKFSIEKLTNLFFRIQRFGAEGFVCVLKKSLCVCGCAKLSWNLDLSNGESKFDSADFVFNFPDKSFHYTCTK